MARDVLMERRVAQAGTLQARSTAVDTYRGMECYWNLEIKSTDRHEGNRYSSIVLIRALNCEQAHQTCHHVRRAPLRRAARSACEAV